MFQNSDKFKQYWDFMNYVNHDKIDLQYFYVLMFFTYTKMPKDLSAKFYQNNKD